MKHTYFFLAITLLIGFSMGLSAQNQDANMQDSQGQSAYRYAPNGFKLSTRDHTDLTNLVIFLRFADDPEIDHSFADIDTMFNGKAQDYYSVYNYYKQATYGQIYYNTVYADQIQQGQIVSYATQHPRGYYQPYSAANPIGYQGELPLMGVSMREAELLAEVLTYVNDHGLVNANVNLDGNDDGDIDNISFIVKGGVGAWASLLWPHMEFFPHDSIDYPVRVNGKRPNTFNFEFEGAQNYFTATVFCHEMGHSLGLPDLYHYMNYGYVSPAGSWDLMCSSMSHQQISTILKSKYLGLVDEPVQITEDGTYTLLSNASGTAQNCYYIKSAIDSTQWFTFEYRNKNDLFDEIIPGTGMLIGRWCDTIGTDYWGMYANGFFDFHTKAHQYWIFRPYSEIDTINGDVSSANFSAANGRTSFGPTTNPHPYLTDGTPEVSFEITDIQEQGDRLTFHVHFLPVVGVDEYESESVTVYPNPATDQLTVKGADLQRVELYNIMGQMVHVETPGGHDSCEIPIDNLPNGLYVLKIMGQNGNYAVKKVVKR